MLMFDNSNFKEKITIENGINIYVPYSGDYYVEIDQLNLSIFLNKKQLKDFIKKMKLKMPKNLDL